MININKMYQNQGSVLSRDERQQLLKVSRECLEHYFNTGKHFDCSEKNLSDNLKVQTGAFVSIYVRGDLRGCIGRMSSDMPLYKLVQQMTISAANNDSRFKSLNQNELKNTRIELSVLTPMKKIDDISEIELGKHGIYIKEGYHSGTFLPQVAEKTNWTKEEFLGYCSQDKARIGWEGWKTAELYIYETIILKEN